MIRRLALAAFVLLIHTSLLAQDSLGAVIEFYGAVQSVNETALVINGQIVDIQSAQVTTPLVVGVTVRVTATYADDGSLTAQTVEAFPPGVIPGIVVISGAITGITDSTITIQGHAIDTTDAVVTGTPALGQAATVYAVASATDSWQARVVIVHDAMPAPIETPEAAAPIATPEIVPPTATSTVAAPVSTPEIVAPVQTAEVGEDFRVEGTLQAFDANSITVDGDRYFYGSARIDGTLRVGARVRLEIRVLSSGEWIVEEVRIRD